MKKIMIGCDPNAEDYKNKLIDFLKAKGNEVIDMGSDDPIYANTAFRVAQAVASGEADRGVLICGTGLGVSISANKVKGAYAALLNDVYSAERAVKSNNSNIACIGAFTLGYRLAEKLVDVWLNTEYDEGTPSAEKIEAIKGYEQTC